ncbi:MAG: hypothetical protein N3F10_04535 [Candidatus Bathyarchaeota archaeon]|nr:hypothetical protein [Candidatus Bathyarchaeota archaeon]MCX8177549.1 hypothetical protein [Candidatus Bathyarchaeota archaeon]MDW8194361.1 hypothetical protein [Nitrososphaerota archaeon]
MKAKVAVATVSGRAYYLIVNELKKLKIPFLSLTPFESIPVDVRVVITTFKEHSLINHDSVLIFKGEDELPALMNHVIKILEGKAAYEKIIIGVDPGEVFGLAVLADGKVISTGNCFSVEETINRIDGILKSLKDMDSPSIIVKVGDGTPKYRDELLRAMDEQLPPWVALETVSEAGTNRLSSEAKHRRGLRDIGSAIEIARRNGYKIQRRASYEHNG